MEGTRGKLQSGNRLMQVEKKNIVHLGTDVEVLPSSEQNNKNMLEFWIQQKPPFGKHRAEWHFRPGSSVWRQTLRGTDRITSQQKL